MSRGSTGAAVGTARAEDSEGAGAGPITGATGSEDGFTDATAGIDEDDADAEREDCDNCDDDGFVSETCVFVSGNGRSCGLEFSLGAAAAAGCCSCC
jgi:hypothetical protein